MFNVSEVIMSEIRDHIYLIVVLRRHHSKDKITGLDQQQAVSAKYAMGQRHLGGITTTYECAVIETLGIRPE